MMYAFDNETSREVTPQKVTERTQRSSKSYFNNYNTKLNDIDGDSIESIKPRNL